jgi:voltage-gated potassium channel
VLRFLKNKAVSEGGVRSALMTWLTSRTPRAMAFAVLAVILFGAVGFMIVGGIGPIEALYMAVITVSTVGFGNSVESDAGLLFATLYTVLGVGVVSLTISTLASALVAGRVTEVFGRRRMERQISMLEDHLILCGYGRIGRITGMQIHAKNVPLVVIDNDPAQIDEADDDGVLGLVHDATEEDALEKAGIKRARALICCLPTDAENVYAILNARELRHDLLIVALSRTAKAERKLMVAGANHVVSPYTIGARHMARQILSPNLARVMNLASGEGDGLEQVGVQLDEFVLSKGSPLIGVTLQESPIRREFGVILVAIINPDGTQRFNPGPDFVLQEGAVLVSIGPSAGQAKLRAAAAEPARPTPEA